MHEEFIERAVEKIKEIEAVIIFLNDIPSFEEREKDLAIIGVIDILKAQIKEIKLSLSDKVLEKWAQR